MDQRLETFLTVCATMNYRKAAEQLHLTQPAVTKQIQALEALYGVRLFTYDSRMLFFFNDWAPTVIYSWF